jgi:hypothetical protein
VGVVVLVLAATCTNSNGDAPTLKTFVEERSLYLPDSPSPPEAFHAHGMLCMRCHASGLPSVERAECMRCRVKIHISWPLENGLLSPDSQLSFLDPPSIYGQTQESGGNLSDSRLPHKSSLFVNSSILDSVPEPE